MGVLNSPESLGFIGGLVLSIYNLLKVAKLPNEERPSFDIFYWIAFIFWPLLGLLFVHVYCLSGMQVKGLVALQVGLTSPLILKGLISKPITSETIIKTPPEA